ncbi:MAG TPA: hypothetical protein VIK06_06125 [Candidatus Limnocylindrales bacterium]
MPDEAARLPAPGPSFLRRIALGPGDDRLLGMTQPQTIADGWWVALMWCEVEGGLVQFRELAPASGIPPGSPLLRLGPGPAGALSGLILEEGGRQQLRVRLGQPPVDETKPWKSPLAILAGFRFEPARVVTMRDNELAQTVLEAFREAVKRLSY